MPQPHTLLLFSLAVLGLLFTPGPNMALLFAHSLARGPRGGVAVATGILLADLLMGALTAAGVTAVMLALPGSFDAIRLVGAGYLLWLATVALRPQAPLAAAKAAPSRPFASILRQALLNSLLNPKALLFFVVFLPQFVDPGMGSVALQLAVLGAWLALEAWLFHAGLGVLGGVLSQRLSGARVQAAARRIQAVVFIGLAVRLLAMTQSGAP